jgi:hypothetical protein
MGTLEVPKDRWAGLIDVFDRLAKDRPVRVEVAAEDLGDQELGRMLPLLGIEFERKGAAAGDLLISFGAESERQAFDHWVEAPSSISVGYNDVGQLEWLAIGAKGGGKTLLYFESLPQISWETSEPASAL